MKKLFVSSLVLIISSASAWACDSCGCEICDPGSLGGIYKTLATTNSNGSALASTDNTYLFAQIAEQYTDFSTVRNAPAGVSTDQYEHSLQTQFIVGYQFSQNLTLQLNIPYIYRSYQIENAAGTGLINGQVNGLGDVRVVLNYVAFRKETPDWGFSWRVSGGVKLPIGDPNLLDQESPTAAPTALNSPNSAVGGHDLALGSGSYDGIIGTGIEVNWQRAFLTADADYTIRGTGEAGYRYANEFAWSVGPGYRVWSDSLHSLSLQVRASGEYKGADTVQSTITDDTMVSSVSVGPNVIFNWTNVLAAHLELEVPVHQKCDDGFQLLPTYRIKFGVTFRF